MVTQPTAELGQVIDEAAHWLMRLTAGNMTDAEHAACAAWRDRSAEHQRVWDCAKRLQQHFDEVTPNVGMAVLDSNSRQRHRRGRRTACALVGLPALGWLVLQARHGPIVAGDHYETARGERRNIALADGTQLVLNTATIVRVRYTASERLIELQSGEVFITTARDTAPSHRHLRVVADAGHLRALGTRFLVRSQANTVMLSVYDGAVEARPAHRPADATIVGAGMQLRMTQSGTSPPALIQRGNDAWTRGVLIAEGMPLAAFLLEVGRYRRGYLGCDPAVSDLRVWGVFQLSDIDTILAVVSTSLGLAVRTRTSYWTTLSPER